MPDSTDSPQYIQLPLFPTRICRQCQKEFPLTSEYWYRHPRAKEGLRNFCKSCCDEKRRDYYNSNKEKANEWSRQNYIANREKKREAKRRWYANNRIKARERLAFYANNHREEARERTRRWSADNLDRKRNTDRNWRQNNREKKKIIDARNKARRKGAEGSHTPEEVQQLYQQQCGKCYHCGVEFNGKFTEDHIIPISRGGSNYIENIGLLCVSCNCSKGAKLLHEWCPDRYSPPDQ